MNATVSATPSVLADNIFLVLRGLRRRTDGRTDDADLILARIIARAVWGHGWRNSTQHEADRATGEAE